MYHVSAQGVDKRMINVHYYYYYYKQVLWCCELVTTCPRSSLDYCTRSSATVNNSNAKIHFDYGAGCPLYKSVQITPGQNHHHPPSRKMNGRLLGMWRSVNREDPITVGGGDQKKNKKNHPHNSSDHNWRYWSDSPFKHVGGGSSNIVICGHCHVILPLTIEDTLKRLSSLPILMQNHSGGDSVELDVVSDPPPSPQVLLESSLDCSLSK